MKLIEPQAIRLLSSTVPENDAPAWSAGTAYEIGDSVIHEHRVYKAVTASTGKRPDQNCEGTDAAWRLMGPTNRYAMLDQYVSTQTVAPMDAETLTGSYPGLAQSMTQVLHAADEQANKWIAQMPSSH